MFTKRLAVACSIFLALSLILNGCSLMGGTSSPTSQDETLPPLALPSQLAGPATTEPAQPRKEVTGSITTGNPVAGAAAAIGPNGGTIKVTETGNPIAGLELTIPAKAYSDTRQVKISSASIQGQTFGQAFNPITPMIIIDNGGGYSEEPMNIKIPIKVPAGKFAMGFIYDDKTRKLEGLPLESLDANSITISTRHFSSFIVSVIDEIQLKKDIDSGFRPGVDDWEFINYGSYIAPGGHCAGQALSAIWYYCEPPEGKDARLFARYDNNGDKPATPQFQFDDSLGYRFASVIQDDEWDERTVAAAHRLAGRDDEVTWKAFAYSIQLTGEPQVVFIYSNAGGGHAMVVYRIVNGTLYVADPNYPGVASRKIEYSAGKFTPYNSGANREEIEAGRGKQYEKIAYLAKTAIISFEKIARRWAEVKSKTIGSDKFPAFKIAWLDERNQRHELLDGFTTDSKYIKTRPMEASPDRAFYVFRDGVVINPDAQSRRELKPGTNRLGFYMVGKVVSGGRTTWRYIDFKYLNVVYNAPAATPTPAAKGPLVYRLLDAPVVKLVTKPTGTGVSATAKDGSFTYAYPEPTFGQVTLSASWNMPRDLEPGRNYTLPFQSVVSVGKVVKLTNANAYPGLVDANPFFRVITGFSPKTMPEEVFQYSPDDGKTWRAPVSASDAWSKYYEPGMKQVLQPIHIWPKHIQQYSPPDPSRPVPLTTPPQNSSLPFRLNPNFKDSWPDQIYITIIAEATGLTGGGGSSLATVVHTYKKQ